MGTEVGVNVSVGGRGVKVNVISGVELAGGTEIVAVSVAARMAVAGTSELAIVTGCAGATPSPQAKSMGKISERIDKQYLFVFIANISVRLAVYVQTQFFVGRVLTERHSHFANELTERTSRRSC
jgi:hypothetical protein